MMLPSIPSHLPPWQAGHLAWLASHGHLMRYYAPKGTEAARADLTGAYLSGVDLRRADLREAGLSGADLSGADLRGADLTGADLTGSDLRGADLSGADLRGATGIASIGPVGKQRRIIYAVAHDCGPMIQAGCWFGSVDDTMVRIETDYCDDPSNHDRYVMAVRLAAALVTP